MHVQFVFESYANIQLCFYMHFIRSYILSRNGNALESYHGIYIWKGLNGKKSIYSLWDIEIYEQLLLLEIIKKFHFLLRERKSEKSAQVIKMDSLLSTNSKKQFHLSKKSKAEKFRINEENFFSKKSFITKENELNFVFTYSRIFRVALCEICSACVHKCMLYKYTFI